MRIASFASVLAVAGCASAGSAGPPPVAPSSQTVSIVGPSGGANIVMGGSNTSNVQTLPFSADQVWRALPGAFDSLGITVRALDPVKRSIGNSGFAVRRRLGGVSLSRFIDCGTTQLGPNADDYDVRLTVLTDVRSSEGGSTVTTVVEAVARPINYAQEYSRCTSRGTLEQRIIDVVRARLAR